MTVTIYHNPACGTSRNTLAMIRAAGIERKESGSRRSPQPRKKQKALVAASGGSVRALIREKAPPYATRGLADPALSDDALLDAMLAEPILINRPIVVTPKGTALCRPSELVLSLLEAPLAADFIKEDGEVVHVKS